MDGCFEVGLLETILQDLQILGVFGLHVGAPETLEQGLVLDEGVDFVESLHSFFLGLVHILVDGVVRGILVGLDLVDHDLHLVVSIAEFVLLQLLGFL